MGQILKKQSKPRSSRNQPAHDAHDLPQSWQDARDTIKPAMLESSQMLDTDLRSKMTALVSSPLSTLQTPLSQSRGDSIYRPLDRSQNEIRLLKILPPATSEMLGDGLSFASDTIQCQLEYESMDTIQEINKKKESADAAQSIILDLMFQGMPEAVSPNDPNMPRIAEILKREMKKKIAASNDLDAVTQYTIDPCKMDLLQKTSERSQQTMKRWLFPELNLLRQVTSFESWLKSWIWSPLSGDKT
jgi:hypothetical protein